MWEVWSEESLPQAPGTTEVRDLGLGRGGENSKGRVGRFYRTFIPN
jgi:hypothetical protein